MCLSYLWSHLHECIFGTTDLFAGYMGECCHGAIQCIYSMQYCTGTAESKLKSAPTMHEKLFAILLFVSNSPWLVGADMI